MRESTVRGKYVQSKRKAKSLGQEWHFTQEEWESLWVEAGWVIVPGTVSAANPRGERRTAYAMRGGNRHNNTYMQRIDLSQGWSKDNCVIMFRGKPLLESKYHATSP